MFSFLHHKQTRNSLRNKLQLDQEIKYPGLILVLSPSQLSAGTCLLISHWIPESNMQQHVIQQQAEFFSNLSTDGKHQMIKTHLRNILISAAQQQKFFTPTGKADFFGVSQAPQWPAELDVLDAWIPEVSNGSPAGPGRPSCPCPCCQGYPLQPFSPSERHSSDPLSLHHVKLFTEADGSCCSTGRRAHSMTRLAYWTHFSSSAEHYRDTEVRRSA